MYLTKWCLIYEGEILEEFTARDYEEAQEKIFDWISIQEIEE